MQRLRLRFGRGAQVRFISHLDTVRCWERVFRRASIPLEYSHGFTPHPRIAVAAPLAVGITSEVELVDIWLRKWFPPESAMMMARGQLPAGFNLLNAWEVPEGASSLQAAVRRARYRCVAYHEGGVSAALDAARTFLCAESIVHQFTRGDQVKSVDLRPFVHSLAVQGGPEERCTVGLEVSIGQGGTARPDHVLAALGFAAPADSIHRVALLLAGEVCEAEVPGSHPPGDSTYPYEEVSS